MKFCFLFLLVSNLCLSQDRITAGRVLEIIKKKSVRSVDDLIPFLPEELREQYALVYETRNLVQGASPETPRVLLFSKDGGFQMAFTGDSGMLGGNKVEMITQRPDGKYSFSELVFNKDQKKPYSFDSNPTSCSTCHGVPPRPIWDDYPFWRGTYGSDHDKIEGKGSFERDAPEEFKRYREFQEKASQRSRYRQLIGPSDIEDLAHRNMNTSEILSRSLARMRVQELLDSPDFWKYRRLLIRNLGYLGGRDGGYVMLNVEDINTVVSSKNNQEILERLKVEYKTILDELGLEIKTHTRSVEEAFQGSQHLPSRIVGDNGFALRHLQFKSKKHLSLIEWVRRQLGMPVEALSLNGRRTMEGGELWHTFYIFQELIAEIVARNSEFKKYVSKETDNGYSYYKITNDGLKKLEDPNFMTPQIYRSRIRSRSILAPYVSKQITAGELIKCLLQ